ncbi:MAG TPA: hypothetical protein VFJ58_14870 [Armatimonadota bacterium]|nr:hypothetical protein [Armatimonadota bacterium]
MMSDREKRLLEILQCLLERMDDAHISFDRLPEERALEAALEFDEAYVAACEELGIPLSDRSISPRPGRDPLDD